MGLSSELSYEAGSFSHHCNPPIFLQPEVLRLYFPVLETGVAWSVSLPSCSSWFICRQMWDCLLCHPPPCPLVHQPLTCHTSSPPQLPIFTPPNSLDECFFFNFLVVRLPYSLIFWQFWVYFLLRLVVIILMVVQGGDAFLLIPPF